MKKTNIEIEIENFVFPLLKSKRTYLDIGANIGKASIPFINIFDKIIAFEPNLIALEKFKDRPECDYIQIEEFAISNYIGTSEFTCPSSGESLAHQHGSINKNHINSDKRFLQRGLIKNKVNITTIDSYKLTDVDFIKIDCEGEELNVISGSIETIKKCKPVIYYECNSVENHEKINKLFANIGYNTQRTIRYWGAGRKKCDMLATPNL